MVKVWLILLLVFLFLCFGIDLIILYLFWFMIIYIDIIKFEIKKINFNDLKGVIK